jgi:hypothetical protein
LIFCELGVLVSLLKESEMPTASITMPTGAKIVIEGSQPEVADLLAIFQRGGVPQAKLRSRSPAGVAARTGPLELLLELIDGDFFKTPKDLGTVRHALEEQGHFYPATTLSPLMLRLVRRKTLRRIKDNKRWTYVR